MSPISNVPQCLTCCDERYVDYTIGGGYIPCPDCNKTESDMSYCRLSALKNEGLRVPDYVFDRIHKEMREQSAS